MSFLDTSVVSFLPLSFLETTYPAPTPDLAFASVPASDNA